MPHGPSLGEQLREQDRALIGQRFRTVLDFEHPADATFVEPASPLLSGGHTGRFALHGGPVATVDVSSLLFGLKLPGDFTLIGGYVRPAGDRITATLVADGKSIASTTRRVPPDGWALAAVDLSGAACRSSLSMAKTVKLIFSSPTSFALDDVMFIDNRQTLVDVPGVWTVTRAGLSLVVALAGRPPLSIPTLAAGDDGWAVDETSSLRVRLSDVAGRHWTLTADGKSVRDGRPADAPGDVTVDPSTGTLDRETDGDADNDGYNERRAAFQITAKFPRLRFTVASRVTGSALCEIRGLPSDADAVTADGKLIEATTRLPDGTLLVSLPARGGTSLDVAVGVRRP